MEPFFAVLRLPANTLDSEAAARAEAARLVQAYPSYRYAVMRAVAVVEGKILPTPTTWTEIEKAAAPPPALPPYEAGAAVYRLGHGSEANPHPFGSAEWKLWLAGFTAALDASARLLTETRETTP